MARLAYELLGDAGNGRTPTPRSQTKRCSSHASGRRPHHGGGARRSSARAVGSRRAPTIASRRRPGSSSSPARSDDLERERRGLFWRFAALMELGRVTEAENVLAAYARAGVAAGDAEAAFVVTARHAMLAAMRGRFDEARQLTAEVAEMGRRLSAPDTGRLVGSLHASVAVQTGDAIDDDGPDLLFGYARRQPGHLYEATAAVVARGQRADRGSERGARAHAAGGTAFLRPRWLSAMCELAIVAVLTNDSAAAEAIYAALEPYRNRLVVTGGANTVLGPAGALPRNARAPPRRSRRCRHPLRRRGPDGRTGGCLARAGQRPCAPRVRRAATGRRPATPSRALRTGSEPNRSPNDWASACSSNA